MTTKDKILALINRLDDNVTVEQTIHRLVLLEMVEKSLQKIRQGKWIDHDELFDRLEKEDEESKARLVPRRRNRSSGNQKANSARRPAKSKPFHRQAQRVGK